MVQPFLIFLKLKLSIEAGRAKNEVVSCFVAFILPMSKLNLVNLPISKGIKID